MKDEGFIHEVFFSFQGEGIHVGRLQLFIRFAGCSLGCRYCDSVPARTHPTEFSIEGGAVSNPVAAKDLFNRVRGLIEGVKGLHAISITGGEPLEQPAFLESLLRLRPSWGVPVYLETNGLHPDAAESIFPLVDIISLDIKLPSLCAEDDFLALYDKTLPAAAGRELFCKVVVADGMDRIEFGRARSIHRDH